MKLRFALHSAGLDTRDLVATIDPCTTVGELATYLVNADPQRCPAGAEGLAAADGPEVAKVAEVAEVAEVARVVKVAEVGVVEVGKAESGKGAEGELTLVLVDQGHRVVDPGLTIAQSGLRPGVTVAITRRADTVVDLGHPAAVALIVAGPDSGREFPLWPGTSYIGRGHGAQVQLSDSSVSRRHAKVVVAGFPVVPEVVDLGSANGISVDGVEVPRADLKAGDRVRLGDSEIEVRLTQTGADVLSSHMLGSRGSAGSLSVAFARSPRIAPLFEGRHFDLPALPERPVPSRMPWLAMMLPALMGMGIFAFTRSPYSLMFVLMSPMMMLGNHVEQRRGAKRDFDALMRDFREDTGIAVAQIREALDVEGEQRRRESPSGAECAEAVRQLSPLLWTRRGDTPGFLQLRLGLGTLPSRSRWTLPSVGRCAAEAADALASSLDGLSVVSDVPVVVDLLSTGAVGVSGARARALPVARSLVLQAVSLHSPAELIVIALASTTTAHDWDWLKWVPHVASAQSPITVSHLASTATACSVLLSQLEDLIATGGGLTATVENQHPSHPLVLVLVENDAPAERGRLVQLAEKGWHQGIYVVWLAPVTPSLPAACRVFLEVQGSHGGAGYVKEGMLVTSVLVDSVSAESALAAARLLAPRRGLGCAAR